MSEATTVVVSVTIRALDASGRTVRETQGAALQPAADCQFPDDWNAIARRTATGGLNLLRGDCMEVEVKGRGRRGKSGNGSGVETPAYGNGPCGTEGHTADDDGGGLESPRCDGSDA